MDATKPNQPLTALHVITVPYRQSEPEAHHRATLDAYQQESAFNSPGIPITVTEAAITPEERVADEPINLGTLGGHIAGITAAARRQGQGILMAGGSCNHITGIFGGLQDTHGPDARVGLVWFDAHGDFNTPRTTLSGMLGGMPVAVCAGLAFPEWRQRSHIAAPIPTDRILMVDVRNLDPAEEAMIKATEIQIAAPAPGFPGADLETAVQSLAERCDMIYLHIDSDILDERFVPNHGTKEPDGPDMEQVKAAIKTVMATGKVAVTAVVSVYGEGEGSDVALASGIQLIQSCLTQWQQYGMAGPG